MPKTFNAKDDSPRSGGMCKFLKLTKFRGMDNGYSKFRQESAKIDRLTFPDNITIRKIFKVTNKKEDPKEEEA